MLRLCGAGVRNSSGLPRGCSPVGTKGLADCGKWKRSPSARWSWSLELEFVFRVSLELAEQMLFFRELTGTLFALAFPRRHRKGNRRRMTRRCDHEIVEFIQESLDGGALRLRQARSHLSQRQD